MKKLDLDHLQELVLDTWWLVLLLGGGAIVLGTILLVYPAETILWLVRLLGGYWFVAGLVMVILALTKQAGTAPLIRGGLGILVGLFVLGHPLLDISSAPMFLAYLLAVTGLIFGVVDIVSALQQPRSTTASAWSIAAEGVFSILISILLLAAPLLSVRVIVPLVAISGIIAGLSLVIISLSFRDPERSG